jgi:hypothetical protein
VSGVRDIGKIMQSRAERIDRPSPAIYSAQRNCTGECRRRKSITQFIGASTVCIRCTRRAPKPQEAS